jgi:hypothetical protein
MGLAMRRYARRGRSEYGCVRCNMEASCESCSGRLQVQTIVENRNIDVLCVFVVGLAPLLSLSNLCRESSDGELCRWGNLIRRGPLRQSTFETVTW